MQELIKQQQTLESRRFRNNFTLNVHGCILPGFGSASMTWFYGQNDTVFLVGSIIIFYTLTIGFFLVIPYCIKSNSKIEEKLQQVSKTLEHINAINQSLDNHRDKMLFDDDPSYWKILEKLDIPN